MIELYIIYSDIFQDIKKRKEQKKRYDELLGFIDRDNINVFPETKEDLSIIVKTLYKYTKIQPELYIVVFNRSTYDLSIIKDHSIVDLDFCTEIIKNFMY